MTVNNGRCSGPTLIRPWWCCRLIGGDCRSLTLWRRLGSPSRVIIRRRWVTVFLIIEDRSTWVRKLSVPLLIPLLLRCTLIRIPVELWLSSNRGTILPPIPLFTLSPRRVYFMSYPPRPVTVTVLFRLILFSGCRLARIRRRLVFVKL